MFEGTDQTSASGYETKKEDETWIWLLEKHHLTHSYHSYQFSMPPSRFINSRNWEDLVSEEQVWDRRKYESE